MKFNISDINKAADDDLEKRPDISTNRNQTIPNVIHKGEEMAEWILKLIR